MPVASSRRAYVVRVFRGSHCSRRRNAATRRALAPSTRNLTSRSSRGCGSTLPPSRPASHRRAPPLVACQVLCKPRQNCGFRTQFPNLRAVQRTLKSCLDDPATTTIPTTHPSVHKHRRDDEDQLPPPLQPEKEPQGALPGSLQRAPRDHERAPLQGYAPAH